MNPRAVLLALSIFLGVRFLSPRPAEAAGVYPTNPEVIFYSLPKILEKVEQFFQAFGYTTKQLAKYKSDAHVIASGKLGDAIRQTMVILANRQNKAAAGPAPLASSAAANSAALGAIHAAAGKVMVSGLIRSSRGAIHARPLANAGRLRRRAFGVEGIGLAAKPLTVSAGVLSASSGTDSDDDLETLILRLIGDLDDLAPESDPTHPNAAYEDARAPYLSQLNTVRAVLMRAKARRTRSKALYKKLAKNTSPTEKAILNTYATAAGISQADAWEYEVTRMYDNPELTSELTAAANATPPAKLVNRMLSTRTTLLPTIAQMMEDRALLMSLMGTLMLEHPSRLKRLQKAFTNIPSS